MGFGFLRRFFAVTASVLMVAATATALLTTGGSVAASAAVKGAISTTDDPGYAYTSGYTAQACLNGNGTNCNIYQDKQDVFLSGLPVQAALGAGTYFFAVLNPGGQADPNDGSTKNLSSYTDGDYTNRTFTVGANGTITSYSGTNAFDAANNLLSLYPYDGTQNPGGVYILAVCALPHNPPTGDGAPGVNPNDCKYDAFKVGTATTPSASPLTITKDAAGAYTDTFKWTITKSVDKTVVKKIGGTATFSYTVTVTHDGGTVSDVKVTGTIRVFNPNMDDNNSPVPVNIDGVTDQLSDGTKCTVSNGGAQTLIAAETSFGYTCDLGNTLPSAQLNNTATVSWSDQFLSNGSQLTGSTANFTFPGIAFSGTNVDDCVNVTDTIGGSLGSTCATSPNTTNPTSFTYSNTVNVPTFDCVSYPNTATFTTDDTGATGSASQTVKVCGPAKTGALTIGFWKTTNGQSLIKTYCTNGGTNLGTYLAGLGGGSGPFSNAPTSCGTLATYVYNILNGASASNMNSMLKAQMLGTALDVWFSGPGWTSTKIGSVKPPSTFLSHNNLGTFNMDTTAVCPMVDSLSTGTATCQNSTPSTDAVAAGAVPSSPMSMQAILDYAATTPSPFNGSVSASVWYGGSKTTEEVLKNIFDQFNNQLAFGSF